MIEKTFSVFFLHIFIVRQDCSFVFLFIVTKLFYSGKKKYVNISMS